MLRRLPRAPLRKIKHRHGERRTVISWRVARSELMNIRPLHDRVVLKRLEAERKTLSGIVIPETAKEKPDQGEVLAVGPGKRLKDGTLDKPDVKVGDKVLFGSFAGQAVKIHGEEFLIVREEDLMGMVED